MRKLFLILLISVFPVLVFSQSKSIDRFRKKNPEDNNVFIYPGTIQMFQEMEEADAAGLFEDIEKIRILNYSKNENGQYRDKIQMLRDDLKKEDYVDLLIMNENNNRINIYSKEKRKQTVGFVAIIDSENKLMIIDVKGSLDFSEFMKFKNKIESGF